MLQGAGAMSAELAIHIAHERYEQFDTLRRQDEALEADAEDLRALEALEQEVKQKGKRP